MHSPGHHRPMCHDRSGGQGECLPSFECSTVLVRAARRRWAPLPTSDPLTAPRAGARRQSDRVLPLLMITAGSFLIGNDQGIFPAYQG